MRLLLTADVPRQLCLPRQEDAVLGAVHLNLPARKGHDRGIEHEEVISA
jgi:hypothetical protein